jgi:DNA-binding winged helix-turn-helix (wHTH) protein/tetratricopeptide (TPR) repeat protein
MLSEAMSRGAGRCRFGDFTLDPGLQRLTHHDRVVPLKPKAYDLLCLLLENRSRLVGKAELMDWLWPRQEVNEANLSQTVYELRQALGESARNPRLIVNVPRRGYRFDGGVDEEPDPAGNRTPRIFVVVPLTAIGGEPTLAELGLGIADSLITAIASNPQLVARPMSSVLRLWGDDEADGIDVARRLAADALVEGTLQGRGRNLRANVRIRSLPDGAVLWSDHIDGVHGEGFEFQDRAVTRLLDATPLKPAGGKPGHARATARSAPEVESLVLKGCYCWNRWTPSSWRQAIELFERAIALDPAHARAHAELGNAWAALGVFGAVPPREAFGRAREAVERALALDDALAAGHEAAGAVALFHDWDFTKAARAIDRAIELDPDSANARHLRALLLAITGRMRAAVAEMTRALRANPSSNIGNTDMGVIHYWARRFGDARDTLVETLAIEPRFGHARRHLAHVLMELGEADAALREIRQAIEDLGQLPGTSGDLANLLWRTDARDQAMDLIRSLEAAAEGGSLDPYHVALARLSQGPSETLFEWLGKALEYRSRDLIQLHVSPLGDPVRDDPRFITLMDRCGFARSPG